MRPSASCGGLETGTCFRGQYLQPRPSVMESLGLFIKEWEGEDYRIIITTIERARGTVVSASDS